MFDVNEILNKADLLTYVERAGGKPKKNGNRYSCACPIHGGDNPTAFSIYDKDGKQLWNCFTGSCGGGDAIKFVELWQGMNFKQACEWITGGEITDGVAMAKSAKERLAAAEIETKAALQREEARRREMQSENRHIFYNNNLKLNNWMREKWINWGIDEGMQDFWKLGGCDDFFVDGEYHSPTLTIPVSNERGELMTIRHRIMNPRNPRDKYRPERTGLHSHPFLALPELGYDGGIIWVMEGEKKAMVTWTKADSDWQCIGVPGQEMYKGLTERLRPVSDRVIVVPDPNAELKAYALAKEIGAKFLTIPEKIDDYIIETGLTQDSLFKLYKQARKVK